MLRDSVMQSFATPRLTLERPTTISFGLWRYLVTATIPPRISPRRLSLNPAVSPYLSFPWCILMLPAAYPNTSPSLDCIVYCVSSPEPSAVLSAPVHCFSSIYFAFSQILVCQIMILLPLILTFCDIFLKK